MLTETTIRKKPRALLAIYQRGTERVLRCTVCHLGFSGERVINRACKHIRSAHAKEMRAKIRKITI